MSAILKLPSFCALSVISQSLRTYGLWVLTSFQSWHLITESLSGKVLYNWRVRLPAPSSGRCAQGPGRHCWQSSAALPTHSSTTGPSWCGRQCAWGLAGTPQSTAWHSLHTCSHRPAYHKLVCRANDCSTYCCSMALSSITCETTMHIPPCI